MQGIPYLSNANSIRYKSLYNNLRHNLAQETNNYPKDVTIFHDILCRYIDKTANINQQQQYTLAQVEKYVLDNS